jgi:hypothetical protein
MTLFAWVSIAVLMVYLVGKAVIFLAWRMKAYRKGANEKYL